MCHLCSGRKIGISSGTLRGSQARTTDVSAGLGTSIRGKGRPTLHSKTVWLSTGLQFRIHRLVTKQADGLRGAATQPYGLIVTRSAYFWNHHGQLEVSRFRARCRLTLCEGGRPLSGGGWNAPGVDLALN